MYTFTCSNNHLKITWETEDKRGFCFVCSAKGVEVTPSASDNSAMDAIVLIKEVAERMAQSQEEGQVIALCACHGLGARIVELAQQHQ